MTRLVLALVLGIAACGGGDGNTGSVPGPDGGASAQPGLYDPCLPSDTCSRGECIQLTATSSVCTDRCLSSTDCRLDGLCFEPDGPAGGPVCFASCSRDGDCPAGWVCADTPEGAICAPER